MWKQGERIEVEGVAMRVPTPTHRVLHNLLHSAIMDRKYAKGEIDLRSLYEMTRLLELYDQRIDWKAIRHLAQLDKRLKAIEAWLYLSNRLFGIPLPEGMGKRLGIAAYFFRAQLQARWSLTKKIMDGCMWFSASDIRYRYQSNGDFVSLMKGRARLAGYLFHRYCSRTIQRVWRKAKSLTVLKSY
jgi:hypothetical protein